MEWLDYAETAFAIVTWVLATGWGIRYIWKWLGGAARSLRALSAISVVAAAAAAHFVFGYPWVVICVGTGLLIAACGIAVALLTGAWPIEA